MPELAIYWSIFCNRSILSKAPIFWPSMFCYLCIRSKESTFGYWSNKNPNTKKQHRTSSVSLFSPWRFSRPSTALVCPAWGGTIGSEVARNICISQSKAIFKVYHHIKWKHIWMITYVWFCIDSCRDTMERIIRSKMKVTTCCQNLGPWSNGGCLVVLLTTW